MLLKQLEQVQHLPGQSGDWLLFVCLGLAWLHLDGGGGRDGQHPDGLVGGQKLSQQQQPCPAGSILEERFAIFTIN